MIRSSTSFLLPKVSFCLFCPNLLTLIHCFLVFITVPEDPEEEMDEDTQDILAADYEIGEVIRQRLVQRAVLYFTGEALDEDDYEDEDDEDDEDMTGDEDEDEEDDEDFVPPKKGGKGGKNPEECKQQ